MKALDEVIDYCEGKQTCGEWVGIADALHYLREYRDSKATIADAMERYTRAALWHMDEANKLAAQSFVMEYDNPALTWNELKQMKGKPVWVEDHTGFKNYKGWILILNFDFQDKMCYCNDFYGETLVEEENLGKTWQAYRKER